MRSLAIAAVGAGLATCMQVAFARARPLVEDARLFLGRPAPTTPRAGDDFDPLVVVRHKPVPEDIPQASPHMPRCPVEMGVTATGGDIHGVPVEESQTNKGSLTSDYPGLGDLQEDLDRSTQGEPGSRQTAKDGVQIGKGPSPHFSPEAL